MQTSHVFIGAIMASTAGCGSVLHDYDQPNEQRPLRYRVAELGSHALNASNQSTHQAEPISFYQSDVSLSAQQAAAKEAVSSFCAQPAEAGADQFGLEAIGEMHSSSPDGAKPLTIFAFHCA